MRISESQLRSIIRSVIKENMAPTNEYRPDTVGKTSFVDPVAQAKEKAQERAEELERQGQKELAREIQAVINDVFGV